MGKISGKREIMSQNALNVMTPRKVTGISKISDCHFIEIARYVIEIWPKKASPKMLRIQNAVGVMKKNRRSMKKTRYPACLFFSFTVYEG
jgi:hypothetical protein